MLSVNRPGFPINRVQLAPAVTASAFVEDGQQISLIAAGMVHRCANCGQSSDPVLEALRQIQLGYNVLERRTRHLVPAATEHALSAIRR